jgi:hypothetical protein
MMDANILALERSLFQVLKTIELNVLPYLMRPEDASIHGYIGAGRQALNCSYGAADVELSIAGFELARLHGPGEHDDLVRYALKFLRGRYHRICPMGHHDVVVFIGCYPFKKQLTVLVRHVKAVLVYE